MNETSSTYNEIDGYIAAFSVEELLLRKRPWIWLAYCIKSGRNEG